MKNTANNPNLQPSNSDDILKNNITDPTKAVTVVLPSAIEVEFRDEIGTKTIDLTNKSIEWIEWALRNGLKQSIGDAIAGKAGTDEGRKLIEAKYQRVCVEGLIPTGGSGGGSRATPEIAGTIAFFKSKGSPVKFKGIQPNQKNLETYKDAFTKKAIWPSIRKAMQTMTETDQRDFVSNKVPDLIEKHKPAVMKAAENDQNTLGGFIEAEKMKRNGTKPEAFTVDITIDF